MTYNKHIILAVFAVLFISLFNFWIYWIYQNSFVIGELLIIETILLYLSTILKNSQTVTILAFIILAILSSILFIKHFDKNIFSTSIVESIRVEERRQFYDHELGKIYKNRIGVLYFDNLRLYFTKISSNFFSALDLDLYFSPGSLIEQGKYPLIFVPLFIIGFLFFVANIKIIPIIYCAIALCINSFISLDARVGPLLMFPIISLCIAAGFMQSLKKAKKIISSI